MLANWSVASNTALFRKDFALKIRFPHGIKDNEDTIFFALLRREGKFLRVPEPLAGYRKGAHQRTALKDHELLGIQSTLQWAFRQSDIFTQEEKVIFRKLMTERLIKFHDEALQARDWHLVKRGRDLFRKEFISQGIGLPSSMKKVLVPRPLLQAKDFFYFGIRAKMKPLMSLLKVGK